MSKLKVCILGGTGFVGRHIANRLTSDGHEIIIPSRHRERHKDLLVLPTARVVEGSVHDPASLRGFVRGCDAVINLIGILNEGQRPGETFEDVHVELPRRIVAACREEGVDRLLHMSALGADAEQGVSRYQQTRGRGEDLVMAAHGEDLRVTVFRPSVIFGPEDTFLNRFATFLKLSPLVFPLGSPDARFQPVYVGDVAHCYVHALQDRRTEGQRYNLCGPEVYTLKELVEYTAQETGTYRIIVGLSDRLARLQARVLERVPGRPMTYDNYLSMQRDNVCEGEFPAVFGIQPTSLDAVAPRYLAEHTLKARYNDYRRLARR